MLPPGANSWGHATEFGICPISKCRRPRDTWRQDRHCSINSTLQQTTERLRRQSGALDDDAKLQGRHLLSCTLIIRNLEHNWGPGPAAAE